MSSQSRGANHRHALLASLSTAGMALVAGSDADAGIVSDDGQSRRRLGQWRSISRFHRGVARLLWPQCHQDSRVQRIELSVATLRKHGVRLLSRLMVAPHSAMEDSP